MTRKFFYNNQISESSLRIQNLDYFSISIQNNSEFICFLYSEAIKLNRNKASQLIAYHSLFKQK